MRLFCALFFREISRAFTDERVEKKAKQNTDSLSTVCRCCAFALMDQLFASRSTLASVNVPMETVTSFVVNMAYGDERERENDEEARRKQLNIITSNEC